MRSIRRRLLGELVVIGALFASFASVAVGWQVGRQVDDLLDYQLEQVARSLLAGGASSLHGDADQPEDPARHLLIRITHAGRMVYASDDVRLATAGATGFTDVNDDDAEYVDGLRVFTLREADGSIEVMQPRSLRRELRRDAMIDALWPTLLMLAALALGVGHALRDALRPLDRLGALLRHRQIDALTPLVLPEAPQELRPPLDAMNRLLERLGQSAESQRRFTADAAHELRTPLTALRLQAGNLAEAPDDATRAVLVRQMTWGIDRCTHLIEQLLALARVDEATVAAPQTALSLRAVAQRALIELAPQANHRGVELELTPGRDVELSGVFDELVRLAANLIDNAIKHSPALGTVVVSVHQPAEPDAGAQLWVEDAGPGIPDADRQRAFDRFFRGEHERPGSGLGLAICARIAERHAAQIHLEDRLPQPGLRVRVCFMRA